MPSHLISNPFVLLQIQGVLCFVECGDHIQAAAQLLDPLQDELVGHEHVLDEVLLHRRHTDPVLEVFANLLHEQRGIVHRLGIKQQEHLPELFVCGQRELDVQIDAPRPNQSTVQSVHVVCGHDKDLAIGITHSVQSIEESTESERAIVILFGPIFVEQSIDIFQHNQRVCGRRLNAAFEALIGHLGVRWLDECQIPIIFGGQSLNQRRLPTARHAVKQIASFIRNAVLKVPRNGFSSRKRSKSPITSSQVLVGKITVFTSRAIFLPDFRQ